MNNYNLDISAAIASYSNPKRNQRIIFKLNLICCETSIAQSRLSLHQLPASFSARHELLHIPISSADGSLHYVYRDCSQQVNCSTTGLLKIHICDAS